MTISLRKVTPRPSNFTMVKLCRKSSKSRWVKDQATRVGWSQKRAWMSKTLTWWKSRKLPCLQSRTLSLLVITKNSPSWQASSPGLSKHPRGNLAWSFRSQPWFQRWKNNRMISSYRRMSKKKMWRKQIATSMSRAARVTSPSLRASTNRLQESNLQVTGPSWRWSNSQLLTPSLRLADLTTWALRVQNYLWEKTISRRWSRRMRARIRSRRRAFLSGARDIGVR